MLTRELCTPAERGLCARFIPGSQHPSMQRIISASLFLHPGFLIVDHIHFQYNGFMYGILLWSLLMARNASHSSPFMRVSLTRGSGKYPYKRDSICCATEFQTHLHVHGGRYLRTDCFKTHFDLKTSQLILYTSYEYIACRLRGKSSPFDSSHSRTR